MKVWIYTNVDEQCGNYQYARDLLTQLSKYFQVGLSPSEVECDVVIVNWHPARVHVTTAMVADWHRRNKKVILIWQNSIPEVEAVEDDILRVVDAVISHEPVKSKTVKVFHIEHGILEVQHHSALFEPSIGTAGFLFPWKRPDVVIEAARRNGVTANMICPPYPGHINPDEMERQWAGKCNLTVHKGWKPAEDVIWLLSGNALNIFWFQSESIHDQFGQTGSARLGVAALRPMIISKHRKFRTFERYEKELYVAETEEDVYRFTQEILADPVKASIPKLLFEAMRWSKAGQQYRWVIENL